MYRSGVKMMTAVCDDDDSSSRCYLKQIIICNKYWSVLIVPQNFSSPVAKTGINVRRGVI